MKSKESVPKFRKRIKLKKLLQRARATDAYKLEYTILSLEHILSLCKDTLRHVQTEGNDCSSETPLKSQTPVPPSLPSILQEEKDNMGWCKCDIKNGYTCPSCEKAMGDRNIGSPPISSSDI